MVGTQSRGAERGPGRPREERVTGAVLNAVVDLITEQGIGAVTMDAVAARAGVSKPAIYRRWPTKQDLIIAAAETRIGVLSVPDLGDFRAELRSLLTTRLEAYRLPGSDRLIAGLIGAAAETGAERGQYAGYTERITSETRRILERGIARGEVRPETDVRAAATLVAAPLLFRLIVEQELPDAALVDTLVDLVSRAVRSAA
ncbi:TetR/AcrR family transcriptional regulator [Streptomyces sp. ISL-44]|uniref:TetR/AcrR family transcriptional regulator n=1 Tax=unclassified Streptomyces TaxID=2593676 RepID=UPI001BEAD6DE|nr:MULTISPECIES: TetR/AcrR family transcriptional regulator [unclassified Streptomyces]MBT2542331.1 TetR/AcrR family transcriptional regulator [Streptomyces sp. ISL-44]MCX5610519.1 TetR/AcrR family transcriptional regulator [Streptomyces sp. NBC_00047]UUU38467.1 TetR/AcrR family transcriptional regulator [Streptomyces sp. NBC_00162]